MPCSVVHLGKAANAEALAPRKARALRAQCHHLCRRSSGSPQAQRPLLPVHLAAVVSGTASPAMTPTKAAWRSAGSLSRQSWLRIQCHCTEWSANVNFGLQAATLCMSCRR